VLVGAGGDDIVTTTVETDASAVLAKERRARRAGRKCIMRKVMYTNSLLHVHVFNESIMSKNVDG
jgi:hypothetical protein